MQDNKREKKTGYEGDKLSLHPHTPEEAFKKLLQAKPIKEEELKEERKENR